jgi:hypothetical protein
VLRNRLGRRARTFGDGDVIPSHAEQAALGFPASTESMQGLGSPLCV